MRTSAIVYPPLWRTAAAFLVAMSRIGPVALIAIILFVPDARLGNQLRLMRAFAGLVLVPAMAAWLVDVVCAATVLVENGVLVLRRRTERVEVPCAAIAAIAPWRLPLPSRGLSIRLQSGRCLGYGVQVRDPVELIERVAEGGAPESIRAAARTRGVAYARARNASEPRHWWQPLAKFPGYALVPTLPVFRLHQWIAYGGTFGEYYTYGLQAYVIAFSIYWATCTIYLVLYAAVLRMVAETIALPVTWLAPSRAAGIRRAVEVAVRVLYYGIVPAFLLRLYLLSE